MELTNQLRKRFCKESGVPISVFSEPYFSERLELENKVSPVNVKWSRFLESLKIYKTEQDYYEDYNKTKETCIDFIKQREGYQRFNDLDMNEFRIINTGYSSRDVYKETNDGDWFLSIDMVQANFTSLNYYDSSIFCEADCWENFISKFTENKHFINSKYMRQVIMGVCNPKRQVTYEKFLMDKIMSILVASEFKDQIEVFTNDEIVIKVATASDYTSITTLLKLDILTGIRLKTTLFRLQCNKEYSGYTQYIYDYLTDEMLINLIYDKPKDIKFKAVRAIDSPILLRTICGEQIRDNDKVFVYEGHLAKFID